MNIDSRNLFSPAVMGSDAVEVVVVITISVVDN